MAEPNFKDFDFEVRSAIDDVLRGILGQKALHSLYNHFKANYDITDGEIPYHVDTLYDTLDKLFGPKGSLVISRAVARELYGRIGLQFADNPNWRLQDYVDAAKKELQVFPRGKLAFP